MVPSQGVARRAARFTFNVPGSVRLDVPLRRAWRGRADLPAKAPPPRRAARQGSLACNRGAFPPIPTRDRTRLSSVDPVSVPLRRKSNGASISARRRSISSRSCGPGSSCRSRCSSNCFRARNSAAVVIAFNGPFFALSGAASAYWRAD